MPRPFPACLRWLTILAAMAACVAPASAQAADRPNILLILTDNTGWGDWGAYGGGALRGAPSPHIDKLAADGMRLTNFNTEAQCTPSRSALMTGRYAVRSGTQSVPRGGSAFGLIPWEITIAATLKAKGYATGHFGKWHLGEVEGRFPTNRGFDEWYGISRSSGEAMYLAPDLLSRNSAVQERYVPEDREPWIYEGKAGQPSKKLKPYDLEERRRIDQEITRRAIGFMERQVKAGTPFFSYVPLTATHFPTYPHPDFAGKSGYGDYADMLVQTDAYVGQMLAALDRMGATRNTIVIFTADNGVEDPQNGAGQFTGWTGPWAGTYFTAMEGGIRVPFMIRWPGHVPAGAVNDEIVHLVDLFPTLAAWAGAMVPKDRPFDGIDMSAFFEGKRKESGREGIVIFVGDDLRALKWRHFKQHFGWAMTKYSPVERYSTVPKLVDLIRDPREERHVLEPYNHWTQFGFAKVLNPFLKSVAQCPNIQPGAPDDFVPACKEAPAP